MSASSGTAAQDTTQEVNFDGLVGTTHNYAGLAQGNIASSRHEGLISNPREAALQGLAKMKALHDAGYAQGVLPPQQRPDIEALRRLGFVGNAERVLTQAAHEAPQILRAVCSASSMWTANAATITPSTDAADGRVHFTPANLQSSYHRSLEPETTGRILQAIFANEHYFAHHQALPTTPVFSDEGAANHTRLCGRYGAPGMHLYAYGRRAFGGGPAPQRYPARQTLEASQAVARQHGVDNGQLVFAQQHPEAIDAGVFHNDVIAVGNGPVLLYHERAFLDEEGTIDALRDKLATVSGEPLIPVRVPEEAVSLEDAVSTYLFNSQLLSNPDGNMTLVVPGECQENESVWHALHSLLLDGPNPIGEVVVRDVKQSMRNGGGPACLRLRVVLNEAERDALSGRVLLDDALYEELVAWVNRHYRDRLALEDLGDPLLLRESLTALDELTGIMRLGALYPFQRG
ncbi:N-succinylarginine dihydrolase [Phytohalomonas tamaricis]|uniref:N-succinylarginine dihydrolase n=1 Tax=Phytohalomonas tamaricis TaxID=2081032 RepID=UPI000D0AED46|nr:N-succinylarginine dihydrolase [Phytohalomonas tamaricis]